MNIKNICVVGLGYIGLPTAALLANNKFNVIGVDNDINVVKIINKGQIHIVEPELDSYVLHAKESNFLNAYHEPLEADVFMICVPTPFRNKNSPEPNLDYVYAAVDSISKVIKPGNILILESTSPIGTTENIKNKLKENRVDADSIYIAYCPERVLPGNIINELVENDRIVGGINQESTKIVSNFYRSFVKGKILETNSKTAEMCKLTENSFRDVNIAFANELSLICEDHDINVSELIALANRHPRVNILEPGVGVGGHCISVDPWFLVASNPNESKLIKMARDVNNSKPDWVVKKILEIVSDKFSNNTKIACLGLSFKPDIDDLRESPALYITEKLENTCYSIIAVEPNITNHKNLKLRKINEAIKEADVICCLVGHSEFKRNLDMIRNSKKLILDFCGLLN